MDINQIPLLAMLKGKLGYLNQRQKLIAQNVANADTPGYAPSDLKPFSFAKTMQMASATGVDTTLTNPAHIAGKVSPKSEWKSEETPDSEARLDGNQVVLEEQMIKMGEAKLDYDTAVGLYQQSMGLLHMAVQKPGG